MQKYNYKVGDRIKVNPSDFFEAPLSDSLEVVKVLNYFVKAKDADGEVYTVQKTKIKEVIKAPDLSSDQMNLL